MGPLDNINMIWIYTLKTKLIIHYRCLLGAVSVHIELINCHLTIKIKQSKVEKWHTYYSRFTFNKLSAFSYYFNLCSTLTNLNDKQREILKYWEGKKPNICAGAWPRATDQILFSDWSDFTPNILTLLTPASAGTVNQTGARATAGAKLGTGLRAPLRSRR